MQTAHYDNADDFFELFAGDDFDEETQEGNTCTAYIMVDGVRKVAMTFVYDDDTQTSGTGSWDNNIL